MKKTILFLTAIFIAATMFAQSPGLFNYQGVARNASGVITTPISLQFTIQNVTTSGTTTVYEEQQNTVTPNAYGVFTTKIGSGTVVSGSMSGIDWSSGTMNMQVMMDPSGGGSYTTNLGTTQLVSVPFAQYANSAGWGDYLMAEEQYPSGTGGPTSVVGWQTRALNTTVSSAGTAITRSENNITLNNPGTYYIKASAPAYNSGHHVLEITNTSNTSTYVTGTSAWTYSQPTTLPQTTSEAEGFIIVTSVTAPLTFILNHYTGVSFADGLGFPVGATGATEVYAKVLIQKIQ